MVDIASWNAAIMAALKAYKEGIGAIAALKITDPVTIIGVEYWSDVEDTDAMLNDRDK